RARNKKPRPPDVGAGGSCDEEIAEPREEPARVVPRERRGGIESPSAGALECRAVREGSRGVRASVASVGARREQRDAALALENFGRAQRELEAASAAPARAAERDGRLAAGDQHRSRTQAPGALAEAASGGRSLAGDAPAIDDRHDSEAARRTCGGVQAVAVGADDADAVALPSPDGRSGPDRRGAISGNVGKNQRHEARARGAA